MKQSKNTCLIKILGSLTIAAVSLLASPSFASSISSVKIKSITVDAGIASVLIDGTIGGTRPTASPCTNVSSNRFAFDATTGAGKAMLSLATAAMLAGKNVTISGSNSCLSGAASFEAVAGLTIIN